MEERILFVDDDPNVLEAYQRKLQHVLHVRTAQGPHVGLREIREKGPFAVVVSDMNMPLMNGVEFLRQVRELAPDTVRMMLTGNNDIRVAIDAVNEGCVFRFLTKPCPTQLMGESLVAAIKQYRLIMAERDILEETLQRTVELLVEILSWVSPDTFGRTMHVRSTVKHVTARLRSTNAWEIELAATLGQIGMLTMPPETLSKIAGREPLDEAERRALEGVPNMSSEMIARIPRLEHVAEIILNQNRRFDELASKDAQKNPMGSRILKAVTDLHELRRDGRSREEALKEMRAREGVYDPAVLNILGSSPDAAIVPSRKNRRSVAITLKDLKAGMTLSLPIITSKGRKLIESGTTVTGPLLVRLKQYAGLSGITEPIEVFVE